MGIELGAVYILSEHASGRDSGSVPFFCWKNLEGLLGKMVNRPCMFCISSFIHLDGTGEKTCAVNTVHQTVTTFPAKNNIVLLDRKM